MSLLISFYQFFLIFKAQVVQNPLAKFLSQAVNNTFQPLHIWGQV